MSTIIVNIYLWVLLFSVLVGLLFVWQNRPYSHLHTLPFFLLYLYSVEKFGEYLTNHYKPNVWLFNYSSVFEVFYYMWLFSKMYYSRKIRMAVNIIGILYTMIAITNIMLWQGKIGFHSITFGIGSLLLLSCCGYYFYQILVFPRNSLLIKQSEFWVSTAILFSFGCGFPIFCLNNFYANSISEKIWPIILSISNIINIIFYSLFIVAFACKIQFRRKQIN